MSMQSCATGMYVSDLAPSCIDLWDGVFVFQAEDGIRDLVRSRGLGEVYKRQELHCHSNFSFLDGASHAEELAEEAVRLGLEALAPVSYTHLTLPTSDLV